MREYDIHHRLLKCHTKDKKGNFPIKVDKKKHQFFHALFGAKNTYEIAKDLNEHWIDPNFFLLVVKRRQPNELHE